MSVFARFGIRRNRMGDIGNDTYIRRYAHTYSLTGRCVRSRGIGAGSDRPRRRYPPVRVVYRVVIFLGFERQKRFSRFLDRPAWENERKSFPRGKTHGISNSPRDTVSRFRRRCCDAHPVSAYGPSFRIEFSRPYGCRRFAAVCGKRNRSRIAIRENGDDEVKRKCTRCIRIPTAPSQNRRFDYA